MPKKKIGPTTKLFPMPTMLLAVKTAETTANVMTVVWAGLVGSGPVLIATRIGGFHHSARYIDQEMNFTMNMPSSKQVVRTDYCGIVSGREDNKIATCGFTLMPSTQISSPYIKECAISFECKVLERTPIGKGAIYLAEVLETHVDEEVLNSSGLIDAELLDPIIYGPDGCYYRLGQKLGKERDLGLALKK